MRVLLVEDEAVLRDTLKARLVEAGFTVDLAQDGEEGVFAGAIGFPTVAKGKARIRVMVSAAHSQDDLERGLDAFEKVGKAMGLLKGS